MCHVYWLTSMRAPDIIQRCNISVSAWLRMGGAAMSQELQKLLEEVRRDIDQAEAAVAKLRQVEDYLSNKLHGQILSADIHGYPSATNGTSHELTQIAAAEQVLREAGRSLNTNDLVDEIVRRGLYPERGDRKQLVNSIYSAMRRSSRFVRTGRGVWSLAEREGQR